MARIPEDVIQSLKREVSLERLVEASGVELKRQGLNLVGRCPWHEDNGPSLVVTPAKNLWHCLGACQQGGSVIDWVMKTREVSFRHAVEILRSDAPIPPVNGHGRRVLPSPVSTEAEDRELLAQVVAYYHETLKQSPEALHYLESRGLRSSETITYFKLGFANRTLGYRLPGPKARDRLQRLGIIRESGHEHFNGSLVVPIFGESGEVLGMYGRKVTPESKLRKGTPLHLYLPGPHRGLFNSEALRASKTVILCEALIDALTFWCAGHRNVTASYGVEGFTTDHLEAFKRHGTERVLIAYDRDEAGERAAVALAEKLLGEAIECFRVHFPKGMDANEYALKVTPAEKSLGVLLRNAAWLGKGKRAVVLDRDFTVEPDEATPATEAQPLEVASAVPEAPSAPGPTPPAAKTSDRAQTGALVSSLAAIAAKEAKQPADTHDVKGGEVTLTFGDRRYRIRGLEKNLTYDCLRVNLLASKDDGLHVDTLDLYSARQRVAFVKQAALELGTGEDTVKKDLGKVLLALEETQEERIRKALEPKRQEVSLTPAEREAAMELLTDPHLLDRILADFEACGVVGEETNKLTAYLAAASRKLEEPLAVIVQSSSAAGKSSLMEAVLAFVPEQERVKYSAMTGQSLFYMGESDLKHKVLAIVEEQGAERATYALKLLQSEGELMIASTGKDPQTGRLVTQEYRVEGPVMIFLTTTAVEIDEELLNRCLVLTVDEDREQTRAIHRLQRERQTLEGLLAKRDRNAILKVHQDAQRLLRPVLVTNPYARHLTFLDDRTRTRRDHVKYLTLIRAIALLHQHQRPVRTVMHRGEAVPFVEVTLEDIAVANRLAHQVLGRSLDELPPQTRRLLFRLDRMVSEACAVQQIARKDFHFSRRAIREVTGWSHTQVRIHLERLVELEYVLVHRGGRGQSFEYELLYDGQGQDGTPFLAGLIDVAALKRAPYDGNLAGSEGHLAGGWRGQNGAKTGGWGGEAASLPSSIHAPELTLAAKESETTSREVIADPRPNLAAVR